MACYLGIDTSNYTTSLALYSPEEGLLGFERQILRVKDGEVGLRQSDAVFQHVQNLPVLFEKIDALRQVTLSGIGVSVAPRDEQGSYMPCFTVGNSFAQSLGRCINVPVRSFSHQAGHIAAAAWSAEQPQLLEREFLAFHVSGGTTEVVHVVPERERILQTKLVASSLDLKAGQAVDRVGQMLSIPFPAGKALEALALASDKHYAVKPFMRDGCPSLSGLENKCRQMFEKQEKYEDIAAYCLDYIAAALRCMAKSCAERYPQLPILFSGGVMSNARICSFLKNDFDCVFSDPFYSSDNAAGVAYLASL